MKKLLLVLGLFITSASTAFAQNGGLANPVISEIMYNPPEAGTDSLEFIEIMNPSLTASINMSGFYFSSGVEYTFPTGSVIPAGQFLVVAVDSVAFESVFGSPALQWTGNALSNGGEGIALRDAANNLVDTVFYDDTGDWPSEADQGGSSLVLCDPAQDNNDVSNWTYSTNDVGFFSNGMDTYADPYNWFQCMTVGIEEENATAFTVFPNPSNGNFRIQMEASNKPANIRIFNTMGQMVYSAGIASGTTSIEMDTDLNAGHYILSIETGTELNRMKLVIQ